MKNAGERGAVVHSSAGGHPPACMRNIQGGTLVVHGGGGHGKVVCEAIRARDAARGEQTRFRLTDDKLGSRPGEGDRFIVAIGDNRVREKMRGGWTIVHPTAIIARTVRIGRGVFIAANAVISEGATIGTGAIVNTGALIDHDVRVGYYAHIAPGAVLLGGCQVGEGAMLGANCVVRQGLHIGAWATVGCGAVVVKDVPDDETWAGNPAHKL